MNTQGPKSNTGTERLVLVATGLMIAASVMNAADTMMVRLLAQDLHSFVIVFFRSLFGLLFIMPWIIKRRALLKTSHLPVHLLRAGLKLLALAAFFTAIATASLSDVTTIAFTSPIFVTIGAWVILGEKPVTRRVIAVVLGFSGVIVILHPGSGTISVALLFALTGAILTAIIHLMLKKMSSYESTETLVAWNLMLTVPLAILPALWFWTTPTLPQLALLALQGGAGALTMAMVTRAMALAEASYITQIEFLRLPIVALFAYLFYGEVITLETLMGASIIFASTLLMVGRLKS